MIDVRLTFQKFRKEKVDFTPLHKLVGMGEALIERCWDGGIVFNIQAKDLTDVATEEDILALVQMGVDYDVALDRLVLNVLP